MNSAVLTSELFASELFGIERGTATGVAERQGLIERAEGGDLFFDEIKDMPLQVQAAVLKAIEQREIMRVGARTPHTVNVRFISATNADIEAHAATDRFRPDLLDRLREGGMIYLPPLRERQEDFPLLVERFVRDAELAAPNAMRRSIDVEAISKLRTYDWPENIRGLRNCIFAAVNTYPDIEHLMQMHLEIPPSRQIVVSPGLRQLLQVDTVQTHSVDASETNDVGHADTVQARSLEAAEDDVDVLLSFLERFHFIGLDDNKIKGKLPNLEKAFAYLMIRYLAVALESTRGSVDDKISYTRAVKWMTGKRKLSSTKNPDSSEAARMIKALEKECERQGIVITDPIVLEAIDAIKRPRSDRKNNKPYETPDGK